MLKEQIDAVFPGKDKKDLKDKVYDALFEPNLTLDEPIYKYLKESIIDISVLLKALEGITLEIDLKERIKRLFYVDHDLYLPNELGKIFVNSEKIALFIGAGVSKLLKVPLWDELANIAIDCLREGGYINYLEKQKLLMETSPKQKLTIFHDMLHDKSKLQKFYSDRLCGEGAGVENNPYDKLIELDSLLGYRGLKITTNLDNEWEKAWKGYKNISRPSSDAPAIANPAASAFPDYEIKYDKLSGATELNQKYLYKIHGTVEDISSAIITTRQYIEAYSRAGGLHAFLTKVFEEYTVLFVGSGIQEFELLEHCFEKKQKKHYALVGAFTGEEHLFRVKKKYYETLNIHPLLFYRDYDDYDRLLLVLDTWNKEIKSRRTTQYYDEQKVLDGVING